MGTGNECVSTDKPDDCIYCYFWQEKKGCCEREVCYYQIPQRNEPEPDSDKKTGDCRFCPYGRHSPCIGYCLAKILMERKGSHGK